MVSLLDFIGRPLTAWLNVVVRFPRITLGIALGTAMIAAVLALTGLKFISGLNSVLGGGHRFNEIYEEYLARFGQNSPFVVVVDDGQSVRSQALARELADALTASGHFQSAFPVLPPPNAWWLSSKLPPGAMADTLWRLEPLRDALARTNPVERELMALRANPQPDEGTLARITALESMIAVVPVDSHLPTPLLWSALLDGMRDDLQSGDPRRIARAAAQVQLIDTARRGAPVVPLTSGSPIRPAPAWEVNDFYAWATDDTRLTRPSGRVALVVVTPWPDTTDIRPDLIDESVAADFAGRPTMAEALQLFGDIVSRVRAEYPDVVAGVTGRPLLDRQEKQAQNQSSTTAGLLSFVLVLVVVVVLVRRMLLSIAIGVSLACALAWSMGFVVITIGALNVLSSAFAVVLCATGVDFGIHLGSAYEHRRSLGWTREDAVLGGFASVGRGVISGTLTTAAAFLASIVADFQAIVELGQIAAAGMVFCAIAMFTVLPALLLIFEPRESLRQRISDPGIVSPTRLSRGAASMTLLLVTVVCVLAVVGGSNVRFNPSRLDLLDPSMSAMPWIHRMEARSDRSSRFGVVVAESPSEAVELVRRFRARPDLVKDAECLLDYLPDHATDRHELLGAFFRGQPTLIERRGEVFRPDRELESMRYPAVRVKLPRGGASLPIDGAETVVVDPHGRELSQLEHQAMTEQLTLLLHELERHVGADALRPALQHLRDTAAIAAARTGPTNDPHVAEAIARVASFTAGWLDDLAVIIPDEMPVSRVARLKTANLAGPEWQMLVRGELATLEGIAARFPTSLDELDPAVRRQFVSRDGKWLVQVYAAKDVWEERARAEFVAFGEHVHRDFTGGPAQYQRGLDVLREGFVNAGVLAFVLIFVLLVIDFVRPLVAAGPIALLLVTSLILSAGLDMPVFLAMMLALVFTMMTFGRVLQEVLLAMAPLLVAVCMTLGTMCVLRVDFNPANIIILPALLGVGIDIGIHLVHAARRGDGHVRVLVPEGVRLLVARLRSLIGIGEPGRRRLPLFTPTATAVLITSMTTIFGFGSLMLAGHTGMRTLGLLFATGIFWCTLAGFVLLPAITRLYPMRRHSEAVGFDERNRRDA
ncbi:MAG: MMPL family transporter [Planctomycetota bacterium]